MNLLRLLWQRATLKSPKLFQYIKWISFTAALVAGIPELLADSGIVLSVKLSEVVGKAVALAGIVGTIVAQLTVEDTSQLKTPAK